MRSLDVRTSRHTEFINLDDSLQRVIDKSGVKNGFVHVFIPHTTAGVTINENADPDVRTDLEQILERAFPWEGGYAHAEGNSAAHMKASAMGFHQAVFIEDGRMALGTWQSVFFCEFDGPRSRKVWVRVVPAWGLPPDNGSLASPGPDRRVVRNPVAQRDHPGSA